MDIDVVVPVYATNEQLVSMARSSIHRLRATSKRRTRVIVLDNGWNEDRTFGEDFYVRWDENRGYAAAVNEGVAHAQTDIVIVSSLDVFVRPGWEMLVTFARNNGGIASPTALRFMYGMDTGEREVPLSDYWGGFMAFPRAMFDAIGGMDAERFPLRHADLDFGLRAAKAGYWVGRAKRVIVEHRDPSISTLLMDRDEVAAEFARLFEVHGTFDPYTWKAEEFV